MLFEFAVVMLLIFLNGLFSMSEIALVSSRKFKLEKQAEEGNKGARRAIKLADDPGIFLSTVQVGITLIGILTGVYGGAAIAKPIEGFLVDHNIFPYYAGSVATALVVIVITYLTLIFGELLPKRLGLSRPETISSFVSGPMIFLSLVTRPIVWLLNASTELIFKIIPVKTSDENYVTEDEIKSMLEQVPEVEEEERDMVERVFFLGDTDVGSLMTSRQDVVTINVHESPDEVLRKMFESGFTNFPVYEGKPDNIIGVLNLKKLNAAMISTEKPPLRTLLREAVFVTVRTKAFKLLRLLKDKHTHFAIAVNEFGDFMGVVTSNDLFKIIAGDFYKEEEEVEIVQREDGSYLVDALISLDEFFRYFDIEDTEDIESQGFFTLGGLVLYLLKHIPRSSEKFTWRDLQMEVIDMDGNRVDKVLVKRLPS